MSGIQESQTLELAQNASPSIGTKKKKKQKKTITFKEIRRLLYYKDGNLFSKINKKNGMHVGDKIGCLGSRGYMQTTIWNEFYTIHRLIWFWHNGYFPENDIDHINRIKLDNRIENLREATRSCNMRNKRILDRNKSGITGVAWLKNRKKWRALIKTNDKPYYIGEYSNIDNAVCARHNAEYYFGYHKCNDQTPAQKYIKAMLSAQHNGEL